MRKLLEKQIPNPKHYSYNILDAIVSTVLTFICIISFKPSFISTLVLADQLVIGGIISAVVLVVLLLKVEFVSKLTRSGRWNLKMDLTTLFIEFLVISVILFSLSPLVIKSWLKLSLPIDLNYVLVMVGFVNLIGFLLYFVSISAKLLLYGAPTQNPLIVDEVVDRTRSNHSYTVDQTEIGMLTLEGKNHGEELVIQKDQLLCISTEGHYVDIYITDENESHGFKKVVFRNSILSMANLLLNHEEFIQCHRSHIINVNHVERLIGGSKKMEARLKYLEINIPVSRAKSAFIKELIDK